jgi:hypothetical protein
MWRLVRFPYNCRVKLCKNHQALLKKLFAIPTAAMRGTTGPECRRTSPRVLTWAERPSERGSNGSLQCGNLGRFLDVARMVTNKQRFEFIQTEPVSARVLARSVLVSLRDGETMISDEHSVTFDSSSGQFSRLD